MAEFHLSLPMGYIDSAPYFCMATETVADLANEAISQREQAGKHPLDLAAKSRAANGAGTPDAQADASWEHLPEEKRSAAKANVDVYLNDFISVFQGGPRERHQMLRHLFHQIDRVLRPNEEADNNRKYSINLKKLEQGDGAWSTQKMVLGWDLESISHLLRLPPRRQEKVAATLVTIPRKARTTSLRKWRKLLGMLQRINLSVDGSRGIFKQLQNALKRAAGRHVQLTTDVHDELEAWRKLVRSLASRTTHLHELETFCPT